MQREPVRVDALAKVTGKAKYAADVIFPNMLQVKALMSSHPHANIRNIDIEEARQLEGVAGVFTAQDIPGIAGQKRERPVLVPEIIRCAGDGVALVAAESEEICRRALKLINVDYEILPPVLDMEKALEPESPIIHQDTNLLCNFDVNKGDLEAGFSEADIIFERRYSTHRVQHVSIETEAAVAIMSGPDEITIYCPCKSPFNVRRMVADTLGFGYHQVRLIQTVVGGSFGGKDSDMGIMASRVALVALITQRPARMVFTREESIIDGTKRHPYILKYKVGAKKSGKICALQVEALTDAGAYASKTPLVAWRSAVEATGPYEIPHVSVDVKAVFTNNPVSDALRGFGSPQVNFGEELLIDELAAELNMDPLQLRLINAFKEGSVTATGQKLEAVCLKECLDKATELGDWESKYQELSNQSKDGRKLRGIGLACAFRGVSLGAGGEGVDSAGVTVSVQRDGTVNVSSGISEVGQGFATVACRITADTLGIPITQVRYNPVDTSAVTDSGPTVASRGTVVGGNAAIKAAMKVKEAMTGVAAKLLDVEPDRIQFEAGKIGANDQWLPFGQVVEACHQQTVSLHCFGWWGVPQLDWDAEKNRGEAYFSYTYAANLAEVEIDTITGKVDVVNFIAVHDVGKAFSPEEVKGQITGGVAMGIGYALMEDVQLKNGCITNKNLDTYLIPTALDTGSIAPVFLEVPDGMGPKGARGLGEPATQIVAPAIVNAINHALGVNIRTLPADLETVLSQFKESRQNRERGK